MATNERKNTIPAIQQGCVRSLRSMLHRASANGTLKPANLSVPAFSTKLRVK